MAAAGVVAIGMGLVTLWRTDTADPTIVCEDVPQAVEQPVGAQLAAWHARRRWLALNTDEDLLGAALRCADVDTLLVRKVKSNHVTLAIALRNAE